MSVESPGISGLKPLPGMPPEKYMEIVNRVVAMSRRGDFEIRPPTDEDKVRHMEMVRNSGPLDERELRKVRAEGAHR